MAALITPSLVLSLDIVSWQITSDTNYRNSYLSFLYSHDSYNNRIPAILHRNKPGVEAIAEAG